MKLCIQTGNIVDRLGFEKGYAAIREAGFEAIDWNLDHACAKSDLVNGTYLGKSILEKPLEEVIAYYADELAVIRKNGLVVSQTHAPFPAYVPGHPDVLDYTIGIYNRLIEYCDYCGCGNLVIHGVSLAPSDPYNTPETVDQLNKKLYESLIPTLLRTNVTVCLENLFCWFDNRANVGTCSYPQEAVAYIDALNAKAGREVFGLCLDTGHLNLLGGSFLTYVPILGKRIKALHIHDNLGTTDAHMAPLTGTIRWDRFCTALHQIGYEGDLDFETFAQTDLVLDLDEELLHPWLVAIAKTGDVFRRKISGK